MAAKRAAAKAQAFALTAVRLRPGIFEASAAVNRRYMLSLPADRLLHNFRLNAGLASTAAPLGGWEQPANELRGHFTGHYLSACALAWSRTGDDVFRQRGNNLVSELAKCQKSTRNGYLSAFPEEFFDRLRDGRNVWAPFYTLHKIMAGLYDMHTLCGNEQALDMLNGMAAWTARWTQPLSDAHMARVLEREYGGMNEVLYNLYALTGNEAHFETAHKFDHQRFFAPLAEGRDELKGLHVNTQIPKIIGAARRYELTGDRRYHDIADFFWREVTGKRCFCTGGTSNDEGWTAEPGQLSKELGAYSHECCCTYNLLKLTRHLFQWNPEPGMADYYERALLNGVLGAQHPEDGMTLYYVPMASGYWKMFGLPFDAFWCCIGTGIESFAKLTDSIYFHDNTGVWVNLFIASELDWREQGVTLTQETAFPEEDTTRLAVRVKSPTRLALRVRVPYWAEGGSAKLHGKPLDGFASPSSYFVLDRTWQDGDKVEIKLPMRLHASPMPDDESLQAFQYGPLVLAGDLGTEGLHKDNIRAEPTGLRDIPHYRAKAVEAPSFRPTSPTLEDWIKPTAGRKLIFRTAGQQRDVTLAPFYQLIDQRYATYWRVNA